MVLNSIFKQMSTSENTGILTNYYLLLCLFPTRLMLLFCLLYQLCATAFLKPRPHLQNNKISRELLHRDVLGVSSWPLGNTKDSLPHFIKAPSEGMFRILHI